MEGARFLLAIVLSIAVVIAVNLLFPPSPRPGPAGPDSIPATAPAESVAPAPGDSFLAPRVDTPPAAVPVPPEAPPAAAAPAGEADTLWIENELVRYGISTRGAAIVSAELLEFDSYTRDGPVQLVDPGAGALLAFGIRAGGRTASLRDVPFEASVPAGDTLRVGRDGEVVTLRGSVGGVVAEIAYDFTPERYIVGLRGRFGSGAEGATLLLDVGPRLAINEAEAAEDRRALGYVVNSRRDGIESVGIDGLEEDRIEEGPLSWVALKNKYFLAAIMPADEDAVGFGGLGARADTGGVRSIQATLPLERDGSFDLRLFFGPQDYSRLAAIGEGLEDVNPYGWRIFRPIIRPLAHLITWMLVGLHNVLGFGYGWVLILFGFAIRGLLWPLNAKAMRSQLKTMELQPRIKEIQTRYKEKPELLQKEMMRLYKEEGFNPLGGCLPLLLPWPVLITLFFVFQNTIEFRGVDFLWLPDLSRPDPFYILPILLGASLFALQFMSLRATPQQNPQMKMMVYVMPVMMVVIFLNFASGLNLYYAASNVASLPQQVQIIRERKRARQKLDAKGKS